MLPFLQREVVNKLHWVEEDELLDLYALAQCTPGIIAVNTATYIGYKKRGYLGAAVGTVAIVLPPLITILAVSAFLLPWLQGGYSDSILAGVRVGVCALITNTIIGLWNKSVCDKLTFLLCVSAFVITVIWRPSPVYMTLFALLLGGVILAGMRTEDKT